MRKKLYVLYLLSWLLTYSADRMGIDFARTDMPVKHIAATTKSYKVIGIKDGDTFVVLMNGRQQVIRLEHIDCPEKKQAFGIKAKQFASNLCYGKFVYIQSKNKYDRYKRLIAEVLLPNGVNVNKALVKNGLAWHYKKHSKNIEYAQLERVARQQRIGVWSDPNAVAPWEWRKQRR